MSSEIEPGGTRCSLHVYRGETHPTQSGQWRWVIFRDNEDYCHGTGYASEDEAEEALCQQLVEFGQGFDDC